MPKAYWIAMIDITDREKFEAYMENGPKTLADHGGRFISRNGTVEVFEGEAAKRITLIEFPDLESARGFYNSPEYQRARQLREGAAVCTFLAVEGLE